MTSFSPHFMDDLRRIRVLREFRERKTVTATAQALHLTPSAVSQQLAGLSRTLGFPVIQRDGRHVVLTRRGRTLLDHADRVFAQIEQARQDLQPADDPLHGTVTIGAFATALIGLLPATLERARTDLPAATIRLRESEPPGVFDQLDSGQVDIALAVNFGSPGATDPRYHRVALGPDPLDVAMPSSHPKAPAEKVDLRDLDADTWITGSPGGCCATMTVAACTAAGFTPLITHQVDDWQALTHLVARGHGVAFIPRLAQHDLPHNLVVRPVAEHGPRRHLLAAVREGAQDSALLSRVLQLLTGAVDG